MSYTLIGRDIQAAQARMSLQELHERELPKVPCIFCGETIAHFNDGGVGWCVGSVVNGVALSYLYCEQPACEAAAKHDHLIWRCGCTPDYVEMVGDLCTDCRRPRLDALPYDYEVDDDELLKLRIDNVRALLLDHVYRILPEKDLQLYGSNPYVSLTGVLSPTGEFRPNHDLNLLCVGHVNLMPTEALVDLRRILTQHWESRNVSPPKRVRPEPADSVHRRRKPTKV